MPEIVSKHLPNKDLSWTFVDGSTRTAVKLKTVFVGCGTYLPGWKWSEHVGKQTGKKSEAHIGYIISGRMMVCGTDGAEVEVGPGDAFEVGPGHDGWVVGDEPCIAVDFGNIE
jgi:hypothetical protein